MYEQKAIKRGYHIRHIKALITTFVPELKQQLAVRNIFNLLEATLIYGFWSVALFKNYGIPHLQPRNMKDLEHQGLKTHSALAEWSHLQLIRVLPPEDIRLHAEAENERTNICIKSWHNDPLDKARVAKERKAVHDLEPLGKQKPQVVAKLNNMMRVRIRITFVYTVIINDYFIFIIIIINFFVFG